MSQTSGLFWRALFAFLALPGVVAFAVPLWWLAPRGHSFYGPGLVPLIVGVVLLLWTVRDFYVAGRGTLAPWSPPQELVVVGLYRISRNPMYIAVILVLAGWAIGFQSWLLGIYALVIAVGFHLRVVFGEEPWLAKTHGEQWRLYKEQVPRWLGVRALVLVVAGVVVTLGIAAAVVPGIVVASGRYMVSPFGLYAAAAFRGGIALVLLLAARESRAPGMLRAMGVAVLVLGIGTPLLGVDRAMARLDWEAEHLTFLRLEGVLFIWAGVMISALARPPNQRTLGVDRQ